MVKLNQAVTYDPLDTIYDSPLDIVDSNQSGVIDSDNGDTPLSEPNDPFEAWYQASAAQVSTVTVSGVDTLNTSGTVTNTLRKSSTQLLREASRMEALAFMPQIGGILKHPAVGVDLKIKLWDRLMAYGVGQKNTAKGDSHEKATNVQVAVIALQPRVAAESLLPLSSPLQGVDSLPEVAKRPMTAIQQRAHQLLTAVEETNG